MSAIFPLELMRRIIEGRREIMAVRCTCQEYRMISTSMEHNITTGYHVGDAGWDGYWLKIDGEMVLHVTNFQRARLCRFMMWLIAREVTFYRELAPVTFWVRIVPGRVFRLPIMPGVHITHWTGPEYKISVFIHPAVLTVGFIDDFLRKVVIPEGLTGAPDIVHVCFESNAELLYEYLMPCE